MPNNAKTVEELLAELFDRGEHLGASKYTSDDEENHAVAEAQRQLYELMLGVIGEDEPLVPGLPSYLQDVGLIPRNRLRAEQRAALRQLFGQPTNEGGIEK